MSLFSLSRLSRPRAALAAAAACAALAAVAPNAAARQDAGAYPDLFKPVAAKPLPAKAAAAGEVTLRTERGPRPTAKSAGVVRAGFESPAGAKAGVVRTAGTAPAPAAFPVPAPAASPLGEPADDLDFFLAPNPVPAAPAKTTAGAKAETKATAQAGATAGATAEPSVRRAPPVPGRTTFSAADFGFAPAAPAGTPADDGVDDPFAEPTDDGLDDPFAEPAGRVTTADATVDPAVKTPVTPAADPAPVDPFAAGPRNPLAPANPLADPLADPFAEPAPAVPTDESKTTPEATPPARTAEASTKPIPKPSAAKIPATVPPAAIAGTAAGEAVRAAIEAPTTPQTAAVSVRWERTGPVRVGRLCTATLIVANAGPADARGVEVTGVVSDYLGLTGADPAPVVGSTVAAGGVLRPVWAVGDLPAGEERRIVLTHRPTAAGDATGPGAPVLAATVRTAIAARDAVVVTEPKLTVELDGTREALIGEPAAQTIRVTNPGTGSIDQVLVEATLPAGLEHRGGKTLTMNVGALAAGQTKPIRLSLTTTAGGVQTVRVKARGEGGLEAVAEASVKVNSPQVELALSGPSLRYVNRTATLTLTVTNPGDAATDNVRMAYRVPDGFAYLAADNSGSYDPSGRIVTWFLGRGRGRPVGRRAGDVEGDRGRRADAPGGGLRQRPGGEAVRGARHPDRGDGEPVAGDRGRRRPGRGRGGDDLHGDGPQRGHGRGEDGGVGLPAAGRHGRRFGPRPGVVPERGPAGAVRQPAGAGPGSVGGVHAAGEGDDGRQQAVPDAAGEREHLRAADPRGDHEVLRGVS